MLDGKVYSLGKNMLDGKACSLIKKICWVIRLTLWEKNMLDGKVYSLGKKYVGYRGLTVQ